jgi:hypothetical protein
MPARLEVIVSGYLRACTASFTPSILFGGHVFGILHVIVCNTYRLSGPREKRSKRILPLGLHIIIPSYDPLRTSSTQAEELAKGVDLSDMTWSDRQR